MILFELQCSQGHRFEAWFKDNATYDLQAKGGLVCPICGDVRVAKAPMAPRIGKSRSENAGERDAAPTDSRSAPDLAAAYATLRSLQRKIESSCDYVGERFPEEARRIHYGETAPRPIYGEASDQAANDLRDEGITVHRVPWLPKADS